MKLLLLVSPWIFRYVFCKLYSALSAGIFLNCGWFSLLPAAMFGHFRRSLINWASTARLSTASEVKNEFYFDTFQLLVPIFCKTFFSGIFKYVSFCCRNNLHNLQFPSPEIEIKCKKIQILIGLPIWLRFWCGRSYYSWSWNPTLFKSCTSDACWCGWEV